MRWRYDNEWQVGKDLKGGICDVYEDIIPAFVERD
jgi:hypothetical protein